MRTRSDRLNRYRAAQRRSQLGRRAFERLVSETLDGLPIEFRSRLENVAIVVEEWPARRVAGSNRLPLFGLYQGTPFGERGTNYHLVLPDRITIYRGPILANCATPATVRREVRDTLIHEIGHYFGLDELELP